MGKGGSVSISALDRKMCMLNFHSHFLLDALLCSVLYNDVQGKVLHQQRPMENLLSFPKNDKYMFFSTSRSENKFFLMMIVHILLKYV